MIKPYLGANPHRPNRSSYLATGEKRLVWSDETGYAPPSGRALYRHNSLGYRSEEFDPSARLKIFVSGCSYAFGKGVDCEESWPYLLKAKIAQRLGCDGGEINLQNFSQIGASNDYIVRSVLRQCEAVRPDLAILAFTHINRTEYLEGSDVIENIGQWNIKQSLEDGNPPAADRYHRHLSAADKYFRFHDKWNETLNFVKLAYWAQCFFVNRRIPYLFIIMSPDLLASRATWNATNLRAVAQLIDGSHFCARSMKEPAIEVDTVERHPGPRSHAIFVEHVFSALWKSRSTDLEQRLRDTGSVGDLDHADNGRAAPQAEPTTTERRILALGQEPCACDAGETGRCRNLSCHLDETTRSMLQSATFVPTEVGFESANDRKARTLLVETTKRKIDFAYVAFNDRVASENVFRDEIVELNQAALSGGARKAVQRLAVLKADYLSESLVVLALLKNVLLCQEHLKANRIPYLFGIPEQLDPDRRRETELHPVVEEAAGLVDWSRCFFLVDEGRGREKADLAGQARRMREGRGWPAFSRLVGRLQSRVGKGRAHQDDDDNIYPLW